MRRSVLVAMIIAIGALGCRQPPSFPRLPGQTDIAISGVAIEPRAGERLEVNYKPLYEYLGLRKKTLIRPGRPFNEFRLAEDRRRIVAFLHDAGRFDAEVDEPTLVYAPDRKSVHVTWHVHEGVAYHIGSLDIVGAPPAHLAMLRAMIPFKPGDAIDLESYRALRRTMAERLQDKGYGHARGYSRVWVDRATKTVAWYYYFDPGPLTRIGTIKVEGNHQVPADAILKRARLEVGQAYSTEEQRRAELALLDTGVFASAVVLTDADIQTGPPEWPDTGGALEPEQVDAHGNLVPRRLPDALSVRVIVVEAPSKQLRAELGIEADPSRIDAFAGAQLLLRNLFVPQQSLVLEGLVGYGVLLDEDDPGGGVYGSALAQYWIPTASGFDLRVTGRWRDVLYPDALLREVTAGPGLRRTLAPNVFLDVDVLYRFGLQLDMPFVVPTEELLLPTSNESSGAELLASFIVDRRNDRVEPSAGWFVGVSTWYSPGAPLGDHRWLQLGGDGRVFHPLSSSWSVGVRVSGAVVLLPGDDGIPLGPRLFGGGVHGMRGYGRDQLSPKACNLRGDCDKVGGRSLFESSIELRLLPYRKFYGAIAFVDLGAAGADTNAFEDGVSIAPGVGARFRSWYVPIGIDVAYLVVKKNTVAADLDRAQVFLRIGEAF